MAGKIFINYRRDDERAVAARVRDRLANEFGNANIFMDVDNLVAGQRFDVELRKALAQTEVFLAIVGPRWLDILCQRLAAGERDYVREEISAALARRLILIPVLIDGATMPRGDDLPEDMRELILHQKNDIRHERFGRDVDELVAAIRAGGKSRQPETRLNPIRAALMMVAALFIVSAAYLLFVFVTNNFAVISREFKCEGELRRDGQSQSEVAFVRLEEYRWWIHLWSTSDGNLKVQLDKNPVTEYVSKITKSGDGMLALYTFRSHDGNEFLGGLRIDNGELTLKLWRGLFVGTCKSR